MSEPVDERLPVTLISGFKGAGKTTLLSRILNNVQGRRIAAIVNKPHTASSDVSWSQGELGGVRADVFELKGGCLCCTLRHELRDLVRKLTQGPRYDYCVIEAHCSSEPLSVAASLLSDLPDEDALGSMLRLDTLVTVVDALNFSADYARSEGLLERGLALDTSDDRSVSDVLAEQVEFANVIVLNKADSANPHAVRRLTALLSQLNPKARVLATSHGVTALDSVLSTGAFEFEQVRQSAGWQCAIGGHAAPPSQEFGLESFVYRARRPFHPGRLWDALQREMPGVLRAKGFFWLASRYNHAGVWSQAGQAFRDDLAGRWWASLPRDEWPEEPFEQEEIQRLHQEPFGDRRQELVFVGESVDFDLLQSQLDQCLLDDIEMKLGRMGWESFADPFSTWWDEEEGAISGNTNVPTA
jgi:G3E family GTPase